MDKRTFETLYNNGKYGKKAGKTRAEFAKSVGYRLPKVIRLSEEQKRIVNSALYASWCYIHYDVEGGEPNGKPVSNRTAIEVSLQYLDNYPHELKTKNSEPFKARQILRKLLENYEYTKFLDKLCRFVNLR